MEMNFEQRIAANREKVWAALNDTDILKASIPGCDSLETDGEHRFIAQVTTKIGPVKAKFKFNVSLSDLDPPNSYTINAEGQGGAAGFANGSAAVTLREDAGDTILAYSAKANVGGKLAQLGSRLIDGTANKMAGEFFTNLSELVTADPESGAGGAETAAENDAAIINDDKRPSRWIWLAAVAVGAIILGWLLS